MALSPNYGWSEPDNSSLVKNGAADIRTLGDAIDTSVWNVGFGQSGKNKIINGNFGIWQRGTSFTTNGAYTADRWIALWDGSGATKTISQQTFTAGAAPVAGYESQYFLRFAQSVAGTGGTYNVVNQRIEDVRTFAGQTVTISFWAKASSSVSMASAPSLNQNFGTGGSATTYPGFTGTAPALTTSWQRFNYTTTVPSVSGKTIGTGSYLEIGFNLPLNTTFTIDIWGVQLEYGSKATPFQTASGGNPQQELAMCQRYLPSISGTGNSILGYAYSTTGSQVYIKLPTTARVPVTGITVNGTLAGNYLLLNQGFTSAAPTAITISSGGTDFVAINVATTAGSPTIVIGQPVQFQTTSANGYILFTGCEL